MILSSSNEELRKNVTTPRVALLLIIGESFHEGEHTKTKGAFSTSPGLTLLPM